MASINRQTFRGQYGPAYLSNADLGIYLPFQFNPVGIQNTKSTNYSVQTVQGYDSNIYWWQSGGPKVIAFTVTWDSRPASLKNPLVVPSTEPDTWQERAARFVPNAQAIGDLVAEFNRRFRDKPRYNLGFGNGEGGIGIPLSAEQIAQQYGVVDIDGNDYNPDMGCLPQIAILETFLRPAPKVATENLSRVLGDLGPDVSNYYQKEDSTFRPPPDCYFVYGNRAFRCKLMSAEVNEVFHNSRGVPERIEVSINLNVLEIGDLFKKAENDRLNMTINFSNSSKAAANQNVINPNTSEVIFTQMNSL